MDAGYDFVVKLRVRMEKEEGSPFCRARNCGDGWVAAYRGAVATMKAALTAVRRLSNDNGQLYGHHSPIAGAESPVTVTRPRGERPRDDSPMPPPEVTPRPLSNQRVQTCRPGLLALADPLCRSLARSLLALDCAGLFAPWRPAGRLQTDECVLGLGAGSGVYVGGFRQQ